MIQKKQEITTEIPNSFQTFYNSSQKPQNRLYGYDCQAGINRPSFAPKYTVIQYVSWDMVRVIFQHGHFLDWCWYVKSICSHWKLLEHKKVRKRRWYRVGLMHQIMLKNGSKQQDLEFRPRKRTTYSPSTSCLFLGDTEFGSWCQYHFDSQGGLTESSDVHKCA